MSARCPTCGQALGGQLELARAPAPEPVGPKSRTGDPDTARDAERRARPHAGAQRRWLLEALAEMPWGATAEELALETDTKYVSVSTRISELKRRGLVYVDGRRETSSGSLAGVVYAHQGALAELDRQDREGEAPSLRSAA